MQIQAVGVAWQIYAMTRDPMALAYVGLAQFLPMLLLLIPAGDLIDRYNRKYILIASWLVEGACSALLFWFSWQGVTSLSAFYLVLVLYGCGRAFTGPALQSLLPQVVPRRLLASAIAANSMLLRAAAIAGPMLGGALYALGGGSLTYALCLGCFLLGIGLMLTVPVRYAETATTSEAHLSAWQRFSVGIKFIRSKPVILGSISLDLFAVLLGGVVALLPIYAVEVLDTDSLGLGLLRSAMALGEVAVGFYLSIRPFNSRVGRCMFLAVAVFGLANLVFALSSWFWVSFIALALAGSADMISVYIRSSLIQFATPDAMRGRVSAVNMLFISSSNELGEFRAGSMAAWVSAVPAAVIGSLFTLGVAATWARLFKPLYLVDRFEGAEALTPEAVATKPLVTTQEAIQETTQNKQH